MAGEKKAVEVKIENKFKQDKEDTILVYKVTTDGYDFVDKSKGSEIFNTPVTLSVIDKGEPSPNQCFIDYSADLEVQFTPKADVVVLEQERKIYIPKSVTQWTFKVTNGNPDNPEHNVTIGDEPPGD
jgi:hypothetical protein